MSVSALKESFTKEKYRYVDDYEICTSPMVMKNEKMWHSSEKRHLDKLTGMVIEHALKNRPTEDLTKLKLLDAGTGPEMRLALYLSQVFGRIVACEPDGPRCRRARAVMVQNKKLKDKTELYNCGMEKIENYCGKQRFDCIVLSHVLNHVGIDKADELLRTAFSLLKPGGFFLLSTAHSQAAIDTFYVEGIGEVTEWVFERSVRNDKFCTHRYAANNLINAVTGLGFEIHDWITLHYLDYPDLEEALNATDMKSRFGRDISIIAQRPI